MRWKSIHCRKIILTSVLLICLFPFLLGASSLTGFSITFTDTSKDEILQETVSVISSVHEVKSLSKSTDDADGSGGNSIVNVVVDRLIADYCPDLISLTLTVQSGGKGNETVKSHHISVSNCYRLETIDIDRSDLISGGLVSLRAADNASYDEEGVKTGGLTSIDIEFFPSLETVEVQNNNLGTGLLRIGDYRYANGSCENMDWMSGNSLKHLTAYGNGIKLSFSVEDSGSKYADFRYGSDVPDKTLLTYTGRIRRGGDITKRKTATLYIKLDGYQVLHIESGLGMDPNSNRYFSGSFTKTQMHAEDEALVNMEYYARGVKGTNRFGYLYPVVYPFGQ